MIPLTEKLEGAEKRAKHVLHVVTTYEYKVTTYA